MTDLPNSETSESEKPATGGHMVPGARLKREIEARKGVEQKLADAQAEIARLAEANTETETKLELARDMCTAWERRYNAKDRELKKLTMPLSSLGELSAAPDAGVAAVSAPGFQTLAELGKSAGYSK